jgi:hypothetical protein
MELHLSLANIKPKDEPRSLKELFSPRNSPRHSPRKSPKEPERDSPKYKTLFKDPNTIQILLCVSKLYQALATNSIPNETSSIYSVFMKVEFMKEEFGKLAEKIIKTKIEPLTIEHTLIYEMSGFYMDFLQYLENSNLEGSKILLMKLFKQYGVSFNFDRVHKIDDYLKQQAYN